MSSAPVRRCRPTRAALLAATVAVGGMTLLVAHPSVAAAADTYPIKLDRAYKVGQVFAVTAKGDTDQTVKVSVNGQAQPDKAEKFTAELAGTAKVLAVNDKTGGPTKMEVTVEKLTKDGAEVFPAGTVIVADHTGEKTAYTTNGAPVEPEKAGVLELLVDVEKGTKEMGQDAMFGTTTPQAVGGQWDADTAKMVADMKNEQIPVSPDHMKASSKLVKVEQVDGKPVETVETTFAADPLDAGKDLNGLTVTGGTLSGTVTQVMPVDADQPMAAQDMHMTMKMKGTAGGGVATAEISMDRTVHRTMTPKQ